MFAKKQLKKHVEYAILRTYTLHFGKKPKGEATERNVYTMSKGSRKREAAVLRRIEEERLAAAKQKTRRRNTWIISAVAVVAAVAIALGSVAIVQRLREKDPDYRIHHTIAASSENFEVTQAMMTYFITSTAYNFFNQYEDNLDVMGLDPEKMLSTQPCYFDKTKSWLDYFAESAEDSVRWMLSFAEAARAANRELNDEEKTIVEDTLAKITPKNYGEHLTKDDIRACLELFYLASAQETVVQAGLTCDDAQISAYYDANKKDFQQVDYAFYKIDYSETGKYANKEAAEALAKRLTDCSAEDFANRVMEELVVTKVYTEETVKAGYQDKHVKLDASYVTDALGDWLFDEDTAVGAAYTETTEDSITVYRLLSAPARNEDPAVNVRHVLLTSATYGSDDKAKAKAEELLEEWKKGDATEDAFGEMAKQHTEDSNALSGGLYAGVLKGQMVESFDNWCFDGSRQAGDTGIVKTNYGYHIMYFVSKDAAWRTAVSQVMLDEQYNDQYEKYLLDYDVTIHEAAVAGIVM